VFEFVCRALAFIDGVLEELGVLMVKCGDEKVEDEMDGR